MYLADIMIHIFHSYWKRAMTRAQKFDRYISCIFAHLVFLEPYTDLYEISCLFKAAVYGLGVCAEFGGSVFKPLVGGTIYIYPLVAFRV